MANKEKKTPEQKKETQSEKAKALKKFGKWCIIIFLVAMPVALVITYMTKVITKETSTVKQISIAKLNEQGLTDEPLLSREDIAKGIKFGVRTEDTPDVNVTGLCDELTDELESELWEDPECEILCTRSLEGGTTSIFVTVSTVMEIDSTTDRIITTFMNNELCKKNVDILRVKVNDRLTEQTVLRDSNGLKPISFDLGKRTLVVSEDAQLKQALYNTTLKTQGLMERVEILQDQQEKMLVLKISAEDTPYTDEIFDDYLTIYSEVYKYLGNNASNTVFIDLSLSDGSLATWIDIYRAYEYGYFLSNFKDNISGMGYTLQFHILNSASTGSVSTSMQQILNRLME